MGLKYQVIGRSSTVASIQQNLCVIFLPCVILGSLTTVGTLGTELLFKLGAHIVNFILSHFVAPVSLR